MLFPSVKGRFARTAELKNVFHPVKGPFARTADVSTSFPSGERLVCPDETANRRSSIASEPPHRARRSAF